MKLCDKDIEAKVEKTMKLLDEMKPLEVNHFFRSRLMQRIELECGEKSRVGGRGLAKKLDLRLSFLTLLLIVNLSSAVVSLLNDEQQATTGVSEVTATLNSDYSNEEFAYYDQTDVNQ